MAIPKYYEFFPAVMASLNGNASRTNKEIIDFCAEYFDLSEEERSEKLQSGELVFANRVGWAKTYLSKAGLICKVDRGIYALTEEGKNAVGYGCDKITYSFLMRYDSFKEFVKNNANRNAVKSTNNNVDETAQSPTEMLDDAVKALNTNLADDLLEEILKMDPYKFESLVVTLLIKMGYGRLQENQDAVTKKSGDDGIDGIVSADKFGFDSIYIQAKRWKKDSTIGRPEVQKFLGALAGQGATKGLFITTARFTNEAVQFAQRQLNQKIVLINGKELADLMIEYNLGVSVVQTYEVKKIDTDYFEDA